MVRPAAGHRGRVALVVLAHGPAAAGLDRQRLRPARGHRQHPRPGRVGDANRARYRIAAALTRGLVPLRADEADRPCFVDPTRPTTAVAAYPGGVVPEDIP